MNSNRPIVVWLIIVLLLILGMIALGGITRLTESGLSMVDWRPFMGVLPPMGEAEWQSTFEAYQAYPEYRLLKPQMTLAQFKEIFLWEYLHRVLGRLIGIVFIVPYLYFLVRRRLTVPLALKLGVGFILGGLQGVLGWWMVKSGLAENPYVSHYRLAAHLGLAFAVFGYLLWVLLDLRTPARSPDAAENRPSSGALYGFSIAVAALIFIQIIYGAFTAGLDAGYMFNTWPRMQGRWLPPGGWALEPGWQNPLRNAATVQWIHRHLGIVVMVAVLWFTGAAWRRGLTRPQFVAVQWLNGLTLAQVLLGIFTLIYSVPITLGVLHQVLACLLWGAALAVVHRLR